MTRMTALPLAASIVVALLAPVETQVPPRDTRAPAPAGARAAVPQPTGEAALSGQVTSEAGGAAIRSAYVVLIGATTGALRVTSTDAGGRFSFTGLPADRYTVGASKLPYLGAVAGARRPARAGTPIVLAATQKIGDVVIRLPRGAAIAGTVTDERGQPAPGVLVNLLQARMQGTERVLVAAPGGQTNTDDRGQYRVHSLPPGQYFVFAGYSVESGRAPADARVLTDNEVDAALRNSASGATADDATAPNAAAAGSLWSPVFFPGTTRSSDAAPLVLAVGEERQGVDIRLERVRTARLDGLVGGLDGTGPANIMITLMSSTPLLPGQVNVAARVTPDGRFTFNATLPGSYTLLARGLGPRAGQFATTPVDVGGIDQAGLQLNLRPALSFTGRLVFEGTARPPAPGGQRIPLRTVTPGLSSSAQPTVTPTTPAGQFTVSGVLPARYVLGGPLFFGATADSVTWALQSVVVDGRDVTDLPFDITVEAPTKDVVVTFGDKVQQLSGKLQTSGGSPASDYTMVVFPADKAYWMHASRRILVTRPGTDGQFTFGGPGLVALPAGEYLLAAVNDIARDEQFDPAFLEQLLAAAVKVTLQAGEKRTQDLIVK